MRKIDAIFSKSKVLPSYAVAVVVPVPVVAKFCKKYSVSVPVLAKSQQYVLQYQNQ
jgi:hypothetical protein